jgi:calcineurin-like phosphoesterase
MERQGVFRRLIEQLPTRFEVAPGPAMVNGVRVLINGDGKALSISRVHHRESAEVVEEGQR